MQFRFRIFDAMFALLGLILFSPLFLTLIVAGLIDTGSPIFRQLRVGRNKKPFTLFKFRTMALNTESVASHLVSTTAVTQLGRFLRRTKLDELPQLWNVLVGDMSLVGPRPCLFNQTELIQERDARSVFDARPGITGLAQLKHIDMSMPQLLAATDEEMLAEMTLHSYFRYILNTVIGRGAGDCISKKHF